MGAGPRWGRERLPLSIRRSVVFGKLDVVMAYVHQQFVQIAQVVAPRVRTRSPRASPRLPGAPGFARGGRWGGRCPKAEGFVHCPSGAPFCGGQSADVEGPEVGGRGT